MTIIEEFFEASKLHVGDVVIVDGELHTITKEDLPCHRTTCNWPPGFLERLGMLAALEIHGRTKQ